MSGCPSGVVVSPPRSLCQRCGCPGALLPALQDDHKDEVDVCFSGEASDTPRGHPQNYSTWMCSCGFPVSAPSLTRQDARPAQPVCPDNWLGPPPPKRQSTTPLRVDECASADGGFHKSVASTSDAVLQPAPVLVGKADVDNSSDIHGCKQSAHEVVKESNTSTDPDADRAEDTDPPVLTSLPLTKQWLYAIGQLGWSMLAGIMGLQLVYFYLPPKDEEGNPIFPIFVPQSKILVIFNIITFIAVAGRLWDAVTDPLIANSSDGLQHPRGRRIPCMAMGGLPAAVSCWFLFMPIVDGESMWNVLWLVSMQALYYLFLTMYCTPYFCLVAELGHTPQERLNLSTWISVTYSIGTVSAAAAPAIGAAFSSDALHGLRIGIAIICCVAIVCMYVPVFFIDERVYCASQPAEIGVYEALRRCLRNPHFRSYVAADFSYWFATAMITTGMSYFLEVLLRLSTSYMIGVVSTIAALSFVFYYPTNRLAGVFGKKRLVLVAFFLLTLAFGLIFFLGWLPVSPVVQVFVLGGIVAIPLAVLGVLPNAILADIAAFDSRQNGNNLTGMYFAARALLSKIGQSAGVMVFASLTNFGKDVGDDLGIRLSGPIGVVFVVLAMAFFWQYDEKEVLEGGAALTMAMPAKSAAGEHAVQDPASG